MRVFENGFSTEGGVSRSIFNRGSSCEATTLGENDLETSISRRLCWNRSTTRPAQSCYLCSRYTLSLTSPGWIPLRFGGADGIRIHPLYGNKGVLRRSSAF
jgi:hypothetical protein